MAERWYIHDWNRDILLGWCGIENGLGLAEGRVVAIDI
mgnify:FL=1